MMPTRKGRVPARICGAENDKSILQAAADLLDQTSESCVPATSGSPYGMFIFCNSAHLPL